MRETDQNIEYIEYIEYITSVRRYSPRTCEIYRSVLEKYYSFALNGNITPVMLRNYEVWLLDECKESHRTVNLHLSVLSGYCRFLVRKGILSTNPVRAVTRPKMEKRLPVFYRSDAMRNYFDSSSGDPEWGSYDRQLSRLVISILFNTGIRRSELISLDRSSFDKSRSVLHIRGKGDKMREIPVIPSLFQEISLYLQSVDSMFDSMGPESPLLVTPKGSRLYPMFVDRTVKKELGAVDGISGRKSPHVLRHTLATELLDDGADLNSIKELLGHSSLAATQVYTHNSVERLMKIYYNAHPRAKNEGKNGD